MRQTAWASVIATLHTFSVNKIWIKLKHIETEEFIKDFWQHYLKNISKIIVLDRFFCAIACNKGFKKTKYSSLIPI